MERINRLKAALAAGAGTLTALWGWLGWLVLGWAACMGLDCLTGALAAARAGKWSSARAREGLWHKCGMVAVVLVAAGADLLLSAALEHLPVVELPFSFGGLVCPMVLVWYIVTELGSIAENGIAMGAPVPRWLLQILAAGRDAVDTAGSQLTDRKSGGKR